ncbi:LAGLIDADG family homing endonuclease [Mesobacillus thioparans]|uniref:LAGLIDADG family homing endonuclease n=1 Tax=Mesobacillus thioparans TaxID=370439 RepID=UPI0039F14684
MVESIFLGYGTICIVEDEVWEASYIAGIIDGEGSITLTRMHEKEHRRPTLTIASTDKELLLYVQSLIGGVINNKKNYRPEKHKSSYTLNIKNKFFGKGIIYF